MCKSPATFLCLEENSLLFLALEINCNNKKGWFLTIRNCLWWKKVTRRSCQRNIFNYFCDALSAPEWLSVRPPTETLLVPCDIERISETHCFKGLVLFGAFLNSPRTTSSDSPCAGEMGQGWALDLWNSLLLLISIYPWRIGNNNNTSSVTSMKTESCSAEKKSLFLTTYQ